MVILDAANQNLYGREVMEIEGVTVGNILLPRDMALLHRRYLISNEMFKSKLRGNKISLSGWGLITLDRPPIRSLRLLFACDGHTGLLVLFAILKSFG
jgi:hypothetical protein